MSKESSQRLKGRRFGGIIAAFLVAGIAMFLFEKRHQPPPLRFQMGMVMDESVMAGNRSIPVHDVTLSPFELSTNEVNNQSFTGFLSSEMKNGKLKITMENDLQSVHWPVTHDLDLAICTIDPQEPNCGIRFDPTNNVFQIYTKGPVDMADYPVVLVSWYGSALYANWLSREQNLQEVYEIAPDGTVILHPERNGWRLPTEAEWEYAATWSGNLKQVYPWGNEWNPELANVAESTRPDRTDETPLTVAVSKPAPWTPVGEYKSPYLHLTGNVWEWCQDWFADYSQDSVTNPVGPATGTIKVLRGGSFRSLDESAWAAYRGIATPEIMTRDIGFRVARRH